MRVSPAARRRLDRMVGERTGAPQALWVRVEGSQVGPDTVGLALVDRPDPVPHGYALHTGWTVPVLVADDHAEALRGARVEYDAGADGGFRVRLREEMESPAPQAPAPETGCVSCSSAALPEIEALRASMGVSAPATGPSTARRRGPALPILGQPAVSGAST